MRTLWERTREAQASRVMRRADRTPRDLIVIEEEDIEGRRNRGCPVSAALAAAEGLLRRLAAAAPAAWRHDPVFRWASIGAGITLALVLLRLAGPHAPELEPRALSYMPPPAGMQSLSGPRGVPSSAVQPPPAEVPKIAPGHPLSEVTVVPTPSSDRFGTFTPARKP